MGNALNIFCAVASHPGAVVYFPSAEVIMIRWLWQWAIQRGMLFLKPHKETYVSLLITFASGAFLSFLLHFFT